jgi:hypothetical protein
MLSNVQLALMQNPYAKICRRADFTLHVWERASCAYRLRVTWECLLSGCPAARPHAAAGEGHA